MRFFCEAMLAMRRRRSVAAGRRPGGPPGRVGARGGPVRPARSMSAHVVTDATATAQGSRPDQPVAPGAGHSIARNTAIFSVATGLSRVAGLVREIVAARYFGTSGPASAFTIAFQVPNLVRGLFADAALSAAFVPVFTELLEKGKRREAFQLAGTLLVIILGGLGALSLFFILAASVVMPLFIGGQ